MIKANYKFVSGIFYYITFVAEDKDVGSTKNFQAFVRFRFKRPTIQFCRLEKPPNGTYLPRYFYFNVQYRNSFLYSKCMIKLPQVM